MVDFTFDIEIHVGGCFVEDLILEDLGGSLHTLTEIDLDKLNFFEIRDLCHLVGVPKEHIRYRYLLPKDDGVGGDVGGVGGDGWVDEIDVKSDYDEVVLEEEEGDENVEDVEVGDRVEKQDAEARGGVLAPSTRSGSTPQAAPQPPSQQPTQTYNMRSAIQPSSSQQGNQARPSHMRARWFSSSQLEFHTPRET
nr:hypothetical protein CFP56_05367 [Quercus suber]